MCCQMPLQARIKALAVVSICIGILEAIFGHIHLLVPSHSTESNFTNSSLPCQETIKANCRSSDTGNQSQRMQSIHAVIIAFQLVIDLPTSVLLLIAANLKKRQLLVPWMFVTAIKMLSYVIGCCIFVHFILIHSFNQYTGFGIKHYSKTNKAPGDEQYYSIFSGSVVDDVIHKRSFFQNCTSDIIN